MLSYKIEVVLIDSRTLVQEDQELKHPDIHSNKILKSATQIILQQHYLSQQRYDYGSIISTSESAFLVYTTVMDE